MVAGAKGQFEGVQALQNILDNEETTQEEIIANVESMLQSDKRKNLQAQRGMAKANVSNQQFDLNTGVIAPVKNVAAPAKPKGKVEVDSSLSLQE
jgi:hypothetical protein